MTSCLFPLWMGQIMYDMFRLGFCLIKKKKKKEKKKSIPRLLYKIKQNVGKMNYIEEVQSQKSRVIKNLNHIKLA